MTYVSGRYDDIINLPHHVSKKHAQMSVSDRAAQFAPFAALTGYDAAITETARLTSRRIALGEDAKAELDRRLQMLMHHCANPPEITVTYFEPDERKDGGSYLKTTGRLKSINEQRRTLLLTDGTRIRLDEILSIEFCDPSDSTKEEQL